MSLPSGHYECLACNRGVILPAERVAEGVINFPCLRCELCPGYPKMVLRLIDGDAQLATQEH